MIERPKSITVIAWIFIVIGLISLIVTCTTLGKPEMLEVMKKNSLPIPVQYALNFFGLAVMIVSGVGMLKGLNWSRFLYIGWYVLALLITLTTSPMRAAIIPSAIFVAIIAYFLLSAKANAYFTQQKK